MLRFQGRDRELLQHLWLADHTFFKHLDPPRILTTLRLYSDIYQWSLWNQSAHKLSFSHLRKWYWTFIFITISLEALWASFCLSGGARYKTWFLICIIQFVSAQACRALSCTKWNHLYAVSLKAGEVHGAAAAVNTNFHTWINTIGWLCSGKDCFTHILRKRESWGERKGIGFNDFTALSIPSLPLFFKRNKYVKLEIKFMKLSVCI